MNRSRVVTLPRLIGRPYGGVLAQLTQSPDGVLWDAAADAAAATAAAATETARLAAAAEKKFTQADVDGFISTRLQEEADRIQRRGGPAPNAAQLAELETLRTEKATAIRKQQEAEGDYRAALESTRLENQVALDKERGITKNVTERLRQRSVTAVIVSEASTQRAVKPAQVAQLLDSRVRLTEDYEPEVLDETGKPAFKAGKPMTVAQLVSDYLDVETHLRLPSGTGGGGSKGGASTDGAETDVATKTAPLAKAEADWKAAAEKAADTHQHADVTRAHQLKRVYERARSEAAKK